jgi:hypothetical protein
MCPGKGMMVGFSPNVPHVSMWSDKVIPYPMGSLPVKPYGFANGGMVDESHINIPDGILKKDDPDKVLVRLMPGELIIPKKHVSMISQFLKGKGIRLSGM